NALDNDFRALQTEHDALRRDYDLLTAAEISAGDVEQMLFDLINQERIAGGRAELAWGKNLYSYAISNSRNMAANQSHEQSSYASWQDVHWAAGYRTADDLVNATMIIWQNSPQYQQNILNAVPTYGAVAVYQSGDIFYITYMSSQFQ
ncbi:MAG: CAP domain-containing protein, partial [Dehalococcoidales bacterium]